MCDVTMRASRAAILIPFTLAALFASAAASAASWSGRAAMLQGSGGLCAGVVGGKFYALAQRFDHVGEAASTQIYDAGTDSWSFRATMGVPRNTFACGVVGGRIYTAGGWDGGSVHATVEAYDPVTDTWSPRAPMLQARRDVGGTAIGTVLYTVGGHIPGTGEVATLEAYDALANTWSLKASMPTPRDGPVALAEGGKLYVIGGQRAGVLLDVVEVYDPGTNSWSGAAPMPRARTGAEGAVVDGKLYVVGGFETGGVLSNAVDVYDPATNAWTIAPPMPTARFNPAVGAIGSALHVAGGGSADPYVALGVHEVFAEPAPPPVAAAIDVRPGDTPNVVNARSKGVIPVAILTSPSFDATQVDVASVRFGPAQASEAHGAGHPADVDGDGDIDLVLHFGTPAAGFSTSDTQGCLTGTVAGGGGFAACDAVTVR